MSVCICREYQKGCDWEIYTTPLAQIFEGAKFCELAYALYDKIGVVLFALQITDAGRLEAAAEPRELHHPQPEPVSDRGLCDRAEQGVLRFVLYECQSGRRPAGDA
jgi:hypothetical protein